MENNEDLILYWLIMFYFTILWTETRVFSLLVHKSGRTVMYQEAKEMDNENFTEF